MSGAWCLVSASPSSYLIIDNGMLKAGTASGGNEEFEIETSLSGTNHAYGSVNNPSCYIAFAQNGQVYGPCGLSFSDLETWIQVLNA